MREILQAYTSPPLCIMAANTGFNVSFYDRVGNHQFQEPTQMWGYWPQLNEWSKSTIAWNVIRVGGLDHVPVFEAYPICESLLVRGSGDS